MIICKEVSVTFDGSDVVVNGEVILLFSQHMFDVYLLKDIHSNMCCQNKRYDSFLITNPK